MSAIFSGLDVSVKRPRLVACQDMITIRAELYRQPQWQSKPYKMKIKKFTKLLSQNRAVVRKCSNPDTDHKDAFMMASSIEDLVEKLRLYDYVRCTFTDLNGISRGKVLPITSAADFLPDGLGFYAGEDQTRWRHDLKSFPHYWAFLRGWWIPLTKSQ